MKNLHVKEDETMRVNNKFILLFLLVIFTFSIEAKAEPVSMIYFTGIGCPHCANTDPVILKEKIKTEDLLIIEYEIYQQRENAPLLLKYNKILDSGMGIPFIIINKENYIIGDKPILKNLTNIFKKDNINSILLPNGTEEAFNKLNFSQLKAKPKIWYKNRIAIKKEDLPSKDNKLNLFILTGEIPTDAKNTTPTEVKLSGGSVIFKNAAKFNGWLLQWN